MGAKLKPSVEMLVTERKKDLLIIYVFSEVLLVNCTVKLCLLKHINSTYCYLLFLG